MVNRNCHSVARQEPTVERSRTLKHVQTLQEGWVGVEGDKFFFKPDRGCNGFALYDSEAHALRYSGCTKAVKVSLKLFED